MHLPYDPTPQDTGKLHSSSLNQNFHTTPGATWRNMAQPRLLSAFRNSRGRTTLASPCLCDSASRQHCTQNPHQKSGTVRESHGEMDAHTMKQTAKWRHQTISMTTSDGWQLQNMFCQIMVGLKWFSQPTKVKKNILEGQLIILDPFPWTQTLDLLKYPLAQHVFKPNAHEPRWTSMN